MIPDKIGGSEDRKPGVSIALIMGKKKRGMPESIGGQDDDDSEDNDEPISAGQAKLDAVDEIINTLTSMKPDRKRLERALDAYCQAWYSAQQDGSE